MRQGVTPLQPARTVSDDEGVRRPPRSSRPHRRTLALRGLLLALVAAVVTAPAAQASTYDVLSCQTPSGAPTSTAGWTPWTQLLYDAPTEDCGRGGRGLTAKLSARAGGVAGGLATGWTFRAPAGTTIARVRVDGQLVARPAEDSGGAFARAGIADLQSAPTGAGEGAARCDAATEPCRTARRDAEVPVPSTREVSIYAACIGDTFRGTCARGDGSRAAASVRSARITLEDETAPKGTVSGAVVDDNAIRGRSSLRLDASDVGAGVFEAQVQIGSTVVRPRAAIAPPDGGCRHVPGTEAFDRPVPCPKQVERTLAFDTSDVRDGSQMLTVTVWDAANNPAIVAFRPVLVDNEKRVRSDGTILMPALGDDAGGALAPLGSAGGRLGPPVGAGDPAIQPVLGAMETLASMELPYCYGGGHGLTPAVPSAGTYCWLGSPAQKLTGSGAAGFDCSSSVSWVLQQAGFEIETMTSSSFMQWGEPGPGRFVTIWANAAHVFLEVDVGGETYSWGTARTNPQHGPGWHPARSTAGFEPRHPPGL